MKKISVLIVSSLAMFPVSVFALEAADGLLTPGNGTQVPEPTSLILIICGLVGVFGARRIFKK